jgi:hypothetical protein
MNQPRGRPFAPGNKQGRGRPKGSPNKARSRGEDLLEEYAPHLVRKCIALALQGERSAMRICMERISPARRDALIRMSLPKIGTAQDVDKAAETVMQGIGRGVITPADGEKMMNIFEMRSRIIGDVQVESRITKLEESMAAASKDPRAA